MENNVKHNFEITSFEEYIAQIAIYAEKNPEKLRLYRGHSELDWQLIPKILRPEYNKFNCILKTEQKLLHEFKQVGCFTKNNLKGDIISWDDISLAQHYGLATRLLDWSTNPLVALWFAFQDEKNSNKSRVVWGIAPENQFVDSNETPFNQINTKVYRPNHITTRITNQSGWFTVHKINESDEAFVSIENNSEHISTLAKFIFPNELRSSVLNKLDTLGVNQYSLFPDLEGLSKYLDWKYFKRK